MQSYIRRFDHIWTNMNITDFQITFQVTTVEENLQLDQCLTNFYWNMWSLKRLFKKKPRISININCPRNLKNVPWQTPWLINLLLCISGKAKARVEMLEIPLLETITFHVFSRTATIIPVKTAVNNFWEIFPICLKFSYNKTWIKIC